MKKSILCLSLVLSTLGLGTSALGETLFCTVKLNAEIVSSQTVSVPASSSATFGNLSDYHFKVNNLGPSKYELEIYDVAAPSRSYADGALKEASDAITWTFWSRDILLEASCKL